MNAKETSVFDQQLVKPQPAYPPPLVHVYAKYNGVADPQVLTWPADLEAIYSFLAVYADIVSKNSPNSTVVVVVKVWDAEKRQYVDGHGFDL